MPQENNMGDVIRLLQTVIGKVDGLATGLGRVEAGVKVLKTDVRKLETKMDRLEQKVVVLGGQFQDVAW